VPRLSGRTALVTGGASGFGAGIVRRFVADGARVIIADLNLIAAEALAAELHADAMAIAVDVADAASVRAMATTLTARGITPDILVNNAGIGHRPTPLAELDEADFDRLAAVNMKSIYLTARAFVPGMRSGGGGVILNMGSTAGVSPRPGLTWYNASKGWVITATRSMAAELAVDRIRVNALNPVAGETPLLATFLGEDTPEARARFLATIPLGRFSTPEDLASAASFLCSGEASMITGVALEVDGGRCI
jgi:3-oxoacyl-[acyl-carrier protein] reductase